MLLEKTSKFLSKVRVSGGGRCNITHACFDNELLVKSYPRGEKELRNVFSRFTTRDTIEWFQACGINLKTEADGRMFPESNSSETVIECLMKEALSNGVQLKLQTDVQQILKNDTGGFTLKAGSGELFQCKKLVIATGGNAREQAYEWIQKLGHTIVKPVPSLFTFNIPDHPITQLMGVSVSLARVKLKTLKIETEGPLLITHWGLSGPAILKCSAIAARSLNELNYHFTVTINWLPKHTEEKIRIEFSNQREEQGGKAIISNSPFDLPKRLWEYFIVQCHIDAHTRWADLSKKNISDLINCLINNEYAVKGKTTFKEEFVTCGGIKLKEINFATMESKIIQGLYFAGEILDIDGITGGFNFQNAWSSGWIAAQGIALSLD